MLLLTCVAMLRFMSKYMFNSSGRIVRPRLPRKSIMTATLQFDIARHATEARTLDLHTVPETLHAAPGVLGDRVAFALCKLLRLGADLFFRKRYLHRSIVLETVASVPGLVGAALQHLRSLRVMRGRADMVKILMEESEERAHAPDGLRRAVPAQPARAPAGAAGARPVLQRLLPAVSHLAGHRAPHGGLFRGRGGGQLHALPRADRRRRDRQHADSRVRARLLAPGRRRAAARARRRACARTRRTTATSTTSWR